MTDRIAFFGPVGIAAVFAVDALNLWFAIVIGALTILILLPRAILRTRETCALVRAWFRRDKPPEPADPDFPDENRPG